MALRITGCLAFKAFKPVFLNPSCCAPCILNQQVRYAARKGYREKANKLKAKRKLEMPLTKEAIKLKKKHVHVERTIESKKLLDPPKDDVILKDNFKPIKYSIVDAVNFHKEYHHPTIFNNPVAPIKLLIEFDMTGKKKTQFLKQFKSIASIPHEISPYLRKSILVFCSPEYVDMALKKGAEIAGGENIVKKIKEGEIQLELFNYVLCHVKFLPNITPIRGLLKSLMPKLSQGTLTQNLEQAIPRFLYGIDYTCVKIGSQQDFGVIDCQIGTVEMPSEAVEENFKALLEDILKFKPNRPGDFVTYVWCSSPPSNEKFAIDLTKYIKTEEVTANEVNEEDDDYGDTSEEKENENVKKILEDMEEEKVTANFIGAKE